MEELLKVQNLTKVYSSPAGDTEALKAVSLTVESGEFIGIVGKSGAGKSTLVNMLSGVDTLSSGTIEVNGTRIDVMSEDQRSIWRGKNVGVVYQSFELLNQLSILENITIAVDFCGNFHGNDSIAHAREILRKVEIEEHALKKPAAISGGQRQRVAIARALANDPKLIIADEPTGNLDSQTSIVIMDLFQSLSKQGKTILMVTHNRNLMTNFTRKFELSDGVISELG